MDGAAATDRLQSKDDVRRYRSPALRPCHRHTPWRQNAARCTCDRSYVAAAHSARRAAEWENCETSTADKHAEGMKASRIGDRWVFVPAPHRPPVFQSTYLGPPEPEIGQSNSRAAIIALNRVQWEAPFLRITQLLMKPVACFHSRSDVFGKLLRAVFLNRSSADN